MTDSDVENCLKISFALGICSKTLDSTCLLNLFLFYFGLGGALKKYTGKEARMARFCRERSRCAVRLQLRPQPICMNSRAGIALLTGFSGARELGLCFPALASHGLQAAPWKWA